MSRIPHPDNLVSGGTEIDFLVQTNNVVVFGEAKWLSSIGSAQGVNKDKSQIDLRRDFFKKFGRVLYPDHSHYVVLGASLNSAVVEDEEIPLPHATTIILRDISWDELCQIPGHPLSGELQAYLEWKKTNSK